jgi:hypothetical protein
MIKLLSNLMKALFLRMTSFLDPYLPETSSEEEKRIANRLFLIMSIIGPLQIIFTSLSPLLKDFGTIPLFASYCIQYGLLYTFSKGFISLSTMRSILFLLNIFGTIRIHDTGIYFHVKKKTNKNIAFFLT